MVNKLSCLFNERIKRTCRRLFADGKITFSGVADWYLLSLFVIPTYFGIRIFFFDMTAFRFFELVLIAMVLIDRKRTADLMQLIRTNPYWYYIGVFFVIQLITNIYRHSFNAIFNWTTDVIFPFILCGYLIVYEYGLDGFVCKIKRYVWILTVISPLQLIFDYPPFGLLNTLGKEIVLMVRSGSMRLVGNALTANGYGLLLVMLLPFCCYDCTEKKISFKSNLIQIILICFNAVLTQNRLSVGAVALTLFLMFFVLDKKERFEICELICFSLPFIVLACFLLRNVSVVRNMLCTFFSAVDAILGSNYAERFGAQVDWLNSSTEYRKVLLENTIGGDWLSPFVGRGGNEKIDLYCGEHHLQSVDNYYIGQYIAYAWPGLIAWIAYSLKFIVDALVGWVRTKQKLFWVVFVSASVYHLSLWLLDQLQTMKAMMTVFAMIFVLQLLSKNETSKITDNKDINSV